MAVIVVVDQAKTHNLHTHTEREKKSKREGNTNTCLPRRVKSRVTAASVAGAASASASASACAMERVSGFASRALCKWVNNNSIANVSICHCRGKFAPPSLFGISAWKSSIIRRWHVACTLHNRFKLGDFRQTQFVTKLQLSSCANLILLLTQLGPTWA